MQHAIEELKRRLETAEHNGKIRRDEGDNAQADLDDAVAADCKKALRVLESAGDGEDLAILNKLREDIGKGQYTLIPEYEKFLQTVILRRNNMI